jgi:hypothetical protein
VAQPQRPDAVRRLGSLTRSLREDTDSAVFLDFNGSFFEQCWNIRAYGHLLMYLVVAALLATASMDRILEIQFEILAWAPGRRGMD